MSQYLYDKVILEKIAAEKKKSKSKSNPLLQAAGIGTAAAGIGSGIGYGLGKYQGNKDLLNATNTANALKDSQIKQGTEAISRFQSDLEDARRNVTARNMDLSRARDAHAKAMSAHDSLMEFKGNPRMPDSAQLVNAKSEINRHANAIREAEARAEDAVDAVRRANNNVKGMNTAQEFLVNRANKEAADTISGATANRLDTIKKYTKRGLGVGLGVGLGAFGAKKLYDKYKGREKKASYTEAVLEKIAQDDMQTQAAQAAGLGASTLAGGLATRNLLDRASKANQATHLERFRSLEDALHKVKSSNSPNLDDIDHLTNMRKRFGRSELMGRILNSKYTRGAGMGAGAVGMGVLGKKAYDTYQQRQQG